MRRKRRLTERIERCEHLLVREPERLSGRWLEEFSFKEIRIEPGCGKGLFTVESAKLEPDVLFIGHEKIYNIMMLALERVEPEGLQNVRYINRLADNLS